MIAVKEKKSIVSFLQCSGCEKTYAIEQLQTYASCDTCGASPLVAHYDLLDGVKKTGINVQDRSMWRYHEMLPVLDDQNIVSLGEGWTPLLRAGRLGEKYGVERLMIKDESANPTGSFKARGLSMAV